MNKPNSGINPKLPSLLFNCTTNVVGGGMKNSAIFIKESLKSKNIEWKYAISKEVKNLLEVWDIPLGTNFKVFNESPARSKQAANELKRFSIEAKVKLVYTMAGPAYINFPIYHVQGLSNGYLTHAGWSAFRLKGTLFHTFRYLAYVGYQFVFSRRANFFVFQTEEARKNYCKRTFLRRIKTAVVSNAIDEELFAQLSEKSFKKTSKKKEVIIFCPGAPYAHKAFQFLPDIAYKLKEFCSLPYKFVVTLPEGLLLQQLWGRATELGVERNFRNIGSYGYNDVVPLFEEADIVFVPSLLETFSASYLEAMASKKILVAADKRFARDVCGEAACYVNPLKPEASAQILARAIEEPESFQKQIEMGADVLKKFGNHEQRYNKIEALLLNLLKTL
jgi:glycosyltransferase involved in cell wall biosynthesis